MNLLNRFETKIAACVLGGGLLTAVSVSLLSHNGPDLIQPVVCAAIAGASAYFFGRLPIRQTLTSKLKESELVASDFQSESEWVGTALKKIIEAETSVLNEKLVAARADIADFVAGEAELKTTKRIAEEITSLESISQILDKLVFRLYDEFRNDVVGGMAVTVSARDELTLAATSGVSDAQGNAAIGGIRAMLASIVASDTVQSFERSQSSISIGAPADADAFVVAPIKFLDRFLAIVVLFVRKPGANRIKRILGKAVATAAPMLYRAAKSAEQSEQLRNDSLTGFANRATLAEALNQLKAEGIYENASLMLVEGDAFLELNQSVGRQKGDELIKSLAMIVQESLVPSGSPQVFRTGAAQFAVILLDKKRPMLCTISDRARMMVEKHSNWSGSIDKWTVSVGIALPTPDGDPQNLLKGAEDAIAYLKDCKLKNRVMFANEIPADFLRKRRASTLGGSLEAFDPANVLKSTTSNASNTGVLRINSPGKPEFWAFINGGKLTKAKLGKLKSDAAVLELICTFDTGDFVFKQTSAESLVGTSDDLNVMGRSYDITSLEQVFAEADVLKQKLQAAQAIISSTSQYMMAQPEANNHSRWADLQTIKDPPTPLEVQTMMKMFAAANGSMSLKELMVKIEGEPTPRLMHCARLLVEHKFVRMTSLKTFSRG